MFKKLIKSYQTKYVLFLILLLISYFLFSITFTIYLPVVGKHAWNEANYLQIQQYMMENGPFQINNCYDPQHYEHNAPSVFLWASYIYLQSLNLTTAVASDQFVAYARFFSFSCTFISAILLYLIITDIVKSKIISLVSIAVFLFSPLVLFFGVRYQPEPFLFMLFFASFYFFIKYIRKGNKMLLICASILFGLILSDKISFLPFVLTPLMLIFFKTGIAMFRKAEFWVFGLCGIASFFLPSTIMAVTHPQINVLSLRMELYFTGAIIGQATASPYENSIMIPYLENSLLPSLGLLFIFPSLVLLITHRSTGYQKICIFSLFLPALMYSILTFRHNIIHMYHSYYFVLPIVLSFSLFFDNIHKFKTLKLTKLTTLFCLTIIIVEFYSATQTVDFYGIGTEKIYIGNDPNGNCYNVVAGCVIRELLQPIADSKNWYALVECPVPAYYVQNPCVTYDIYLWENDRFREYNFFTNETEFTNKLKSLNLSILTFTPGIYENFPESPNFCKYLLENFSPIGTVGVTSFWINNEFFRANFDTLYPTFKKLLDHENLEKLCSFCPQKIINDMSKSQVSYEKLKFNISSNLIRFDDFKPMFDQFEVNVSIPIIQVSTNSLCGPWSWIRSAEIPVLDSETYILITYVKWNNVNQSHIAIEGYDNKTGGWYQITQLPYGLDGNGDWTKYVWALKPNQNVTKIRVVLNAGWVQNAEGGIATTWFGFPEVYKVDPEGSAFVILHSEQQNYIFKKESVIFP